MMPASRCRSGHEALSEGLLAIGLVAVQGQSYDWSEPINLQGQVEPISSSHQKVGTGSTALISPFLSVMMTAHASIQP